MSLYFFIRVRIKVSSMQMIFPNLITQISMLSYNGEVHANVVFDKEVITVTISLSLSLSLSLFARVCVCEPCFNQIERAHIQTLSPLPK
jgi:hypothetical protein